MMYHKKKIALFISHIFGDYQKNVCQGVVDLASDYGFQTEVYATSDGEDLGNYDVGEDSILRIPNFEDFDGIIVASDTYPKLELKDKLIHLLQDKCTCPIIEINNHDAQFPAIILENNLSTGSLTEHLITVHNCSRICYLGCSTERFYSDQREQAYRNTLNLFSIPLDDSNVFLCDYSNESIHNALIQFTSDQSSCKLDAVVCYNDRMALLFMMEAMNMGYSVPNDFAIVGCDCIKEGQNITPPLTTVTFPVYQLGVKSIEQLMHLIHHETIPNRTCIFSEPHIGGSCGCNYISGKNPIFYGKELVDRIKDVESSIFTSMKMSADFSHICDIDDGMDILSKYISKIDGCSEFYLCLYSNWDTVSDQILELVDTDLEKEDYDNTILMKFAMKQGKRLPECSFSKHTLLPEYINHDSNAARVISPLFFENRAFGYVVLAYKNNQIDYHFQLVHWIMNITQLLQNLCEAKGSKLMLAKLEDIYMKDSLTGLYNRHGYERHLNQLLNTMQSGDTLTVLLLDMDCLKSINDQFGHHEGDFALKLIGQALLSTTQEQRNELFCSRFGGDEFLVVSNHLDADAVQEYVENIDNYLRHYNELNKKPYVVSVSCGWSAIPYHKGISDAEIASLQKVADENMYQNKRIKK